MYNQEGDNIPPTIEELDPVIIIILKENGITTIEQLRDTPLSEIKNLGPISKVKLELFLEKNG